MYDVTALDDETRRKLDDMEANVKDITQRRLDFLEEAQRQQSNFQVRVQRDEGWVVTLYKTRGLLLGTST